MSRFIAILAFAVATILAVLAGFGALSVDRVLDWILAFVSAGLLAEAIG